jgi:pantoate--beta-alanine ligase
MILFHTSSELKKHLLSIKESGKTIGFVPTMGALHQGHITLIEKSLSDCDLSVCSIFINPTQFNNTSDFEKYPKTTDQDILMLEEAGCDILFLPDVSEIYPSGFTPKTYPLGNLEKILEGAYRPGHFQGVCMVVERLLSLVPCDNLYLGRKDYQQCMVIQKLIELESINTNLVICDTKRETDGLAMSSRNTRLNPVERQKARTIYETLIFMKENLQQLPIDTLEEMSKEKLVLSGFEVDYVSITNAHLEHIDNAQDSKTIVGLIAASINGIRLIDNMYFS